MTRTKKISHAVALAESLGLDNALGSVTVGLDRTVALVHGSPELLSDLLGRPDDAGFYGCGAPFVTWSRYDEDVEITTNGPEWRDGVEAFLSAPSPAELGKGE